MSIDFDRCGVAGGPCFAGIEEVRGWLHQTFQSPVRFFPRTREAVQDAIRRLPLQPGDEVLATDQEYPPLVEFWRGEAERRGFHFKEVPLPLPVASPEAAVERFWCHVSPRTRGFYLSHVLCLTGLVFPVAELCRRARRCGRLFTLIDGAHALGQIPVDGAELPADFYAGCLHKWVGGAYGAAFQCGIPGQDELKDGQPFQQVPSPLPRLPDTSAHRLALWCIERFARVFGLEPLSLEPERWVAQMVALPLPRRVGCPRRLQQALGERGFRVSVHRVHNVPVVRLCLQPQHSEEDVEKLLHALRACLDWRVRLFSGWRN